MVTKRLEAFDIMVYTLLLFVAICSVFPMLFVLSVSLTPYSEVIKNGGFVVFPTEISLEAYKVLLAKSTMMHSFQITVALTLIGTLINLILTTSLAYPLSQSLLPGRKWFLFMIVFTLLFNGGLIPTYLVVKATGLINTFWAMIIPTAIASFNVLIMKSFFQSLPNELLEAARMDGAKEFTILWRIVIPLSVPVIITMGLFYGVVHWNQYFQAIMYITDRELQPLQIAVREILLVNEEELLQAEVVLPTTTLQMASVVFASAPVIAVYPFLQKHLVRGMLLGSLKG